MSYYLITLTPTGRFFFGGDMTFQVQNDTDETKKFNSEYASYIIKSNKFPQQTSLLGMLRYLILSNDSTAFDRQKNEIIKYDKAAELIGDSGFCVNGGNDFKHIQSIYPCFLRVKQNNADWIDLLPAPKDFGYKVSFDNTMESIVNGITKPTPVISGYDPKEWKEPLYIGTKQPLKESEIFSEDSRIGISKNHTGVTDTEAFYKQISYRLGKTTSGEENEIQNKFCFAFYAEIDDKTDLTQPKYNGSLVTIGGDNSQFILNAEKIESVITKYPENYNNENTETSKGYTCKIVLLSDSYLSKDKANECLFALSDYVHFKFLETSINVKNYSILSKEVKRSKRYYLYQKGSVFYCTEEQAQQLEEALNNPGFKKIGYNSYQKI